jgi:sorbitol/mannitol transport system permease protein
MNLHTEKVVKLTMVTVGSWLVAALIFFPIFWMILTSFKTELNAFSSPPSLFFWPTLENYQVVFERSDYFRYAWNSVVISFVSSIMAMVIGLPAAYAMAFYPTARTQGVMLWMLSTKMLPPVGVLVPIYLLSRDTGLLDTRTGLVIIYTLINLPIVIWMMPISTTAANKYSTPCVATRLIITTAIAPVAPEIMPGRPPNTAVIKPRKNAE